MQATNYSWEVKPFEWAAPVVDVEARLGLSTRANACAWDMEATQVLAGA